MPSLLNTFLAIASLSLPAFSYPSPGSVYLNSPIVRPAPDSNATISNNTVIARANAFKGCPEGKWLFSCFGLGGCVDGNPCNTESTREHAAVGNVFTPPYKHTNTWARDMFEVGQFHEASEHPSRKVNKLDVRGKTISQVAVFKDVPTTGSACRLMWNQTAKGERKGEFSVHGSSGHVWVRQLLVVPDLENVNFKTVGESRATGRQDELVPAFDFAEWPSFEGPFLHVGPNLLCGSGIGRDIAIELWADAGDDANTVKMDFEEGKNGLFLEVANPQ